MRRILSGRTRSARRGDDMLSGNIGMSMRCGIGRKIVVQSIPQRMEATSMVVVQTENQNLQNINGGTVKVLRDFCETLIAGHFGIHAAPLSQCRCRPSSRVQPSEVTLLLAQITLDQVQVTGGKGNKIAIGVVAYKDDCAGQVTLASQRDDLTTGRSRAASGTSSLML